MHGFYPKRDLPPSLSTVLIALAIGLPVLLIAEQPDLGLSLVASNWTICVVFSRPTLVG